MPARPPAWTHSPGVIATLQAEPFEVNAIGELAHGATPLTPANAGIAAPAPESDMASCTQRV